MGLIQSISMKLRRTDESARPGKAVPPRTEQLAEPVYFQELSDEERARIIERARAELPELDRKYAANMAALRALARR
jgi:hypothetical protein